MFDTRKWNKPKDPLPICQHLRRCSRLEERMSRQRGPGERRLSGPLKVTGSTIYEKVVTPEPGKAGRENNPQMPYCPALAQRHAIGQTEYSRWAARMCHALHWVCKTLRDTGARKTDKANGDTNGCHSSSPQ